MVSYMVAINSGRSAGSDPSAATGTGCRRGVQDRISHDANGYDCHGRLSYRTRVRVEAGDRGAGNLSAIGRLAGLDDGLRVCGVVQYSPKHALR